MYVRMVAVGGPTIVYYLCAPMRQDIGFVVEGKGMPPPNTGTIPIDMESVPRPKGFTLYGSIKLEQNSRSFNVIATASVTYTAPEDESPRDSLDLFEQVEAEAIRRVWLVGQQARVNAETGMNLSPDPKRNMIEERSR
jgi:hypothetical protein